MNRSMLTTIMAAALATTGLSAQEVRLEVEFVDHLGAGMIEQDVYVALPDGAGVQRVTPETYRHFLRQPLFATAAEVHHDPMNPLALGPFPQGAPLGITLEQWMGAEGRLTYTCSGGTGRVEADFEGLVPQGLYTAWYAFMPNPATRPFTTYDLPLGARDGSQSVFTSDEAGMARVVREFSPCLQLSGRQLTAMLAVAWHSDNRSWGSNPGPFGSATHLHLFAPLPAESEMNAAEGMQR